MLTILLPPFSQAGTSAPVERTYIWLSACIFSCALIWLAGWPGQ